MTTAPTDTGKRLSDAALAEITSRVTSFSEWRRDPDNEPRSHTHTYQAQLDREVLLSHIAALTAERGSISEERLHDISHNIVSYCREHHSNTDVLTYTREEAMGYVSAAIQRAVSECSGGGAEEMREAAAVHCDHEVDTYMHLAERYWKDDNDTAMHDCVVIIGAFRSAAKAIRALPLPVSADGRDAINAEILSAAWEVATYPDYMTVEECKRHGQTPGPGNRLKTALLKSKQSPDAGEEK